MKFLPSLVVSLFMLPILACETMSQYTAFKHVQLGMDKSDVVELLGDPKRTDRKDGRDVWYYTMWEQGAKYDRMVVFEDRKVIYAGRVTTPKFVKDADKIDKETDAANKNLELREEKTNVDQMAVPETPPADTDSP